MILAARRKREPSENWRTFFYEFLDSRLDKTEEEYPMEYLGDISKFLLQGACRFGYYPLDEALGLSESSKQYDVQDCGGMVIERNRL